MAKSPPKFIYKSAVTGKIVTKQYAESHKPTTFKERTAPKTPSKPKKP